MCSSPRNIIASALPYMAACLRCSAAARSSLGAISPSVYILVSSQWARAHPSAAALSYQRTASRSSMSSSFPVWRK